MAIFKTSVPDMISARILTDLASKIASLSTAIFQRSLTMEKFQRTEDWQKSPQYSRMGTDYHKYPFKTSLCYRIQEHIIHVANIILGYLEENSIPTDFQHGFWAQPICETQLSMLVHEHLDSTHKGKQMDLGIMDFSKSLILTKPNTNVFLSSSITMIRHSDGQSPSCPTESSRLLLIVPFQTSTSNKWVCPGGRCWSTFIFAVHQ